MMSEMNVNMTVKRKEMSNIFLYSLGKLVSLFGTSIYTFAFGLYVLKETGSGLSFATTLVLGMIPIVLVTPFAGVLADKLNKKLLVVLMDLFNAILFIGLYFISGRYGLHLSMIYVSIFIMTVFTTIFAISMEAGKPNMVTKNKLMDINAISKIIDSISITLGPVIGGLVFAFINIKLFIIINGLTFLFSAMTEILIDFKLNDNDNDSESENKERKLSVFEDIKEGFMYMKNQQQITSLLVILIAVNFFISYGITVPLPYIINNVLRLAPEYFGMIEGAFPIGMILGAFLVKKVFEKLHLKKLFLGVNYIMALSMILIGLPILPFNMTAIPQIMLVYYMTIMISIGVAISFIDVPLLYILQRSIPEEYRGRVLGIGISIGKIVAPLALILSGWFVSTLPAFLPSIVGGILFILFNIGYVQHRKLDGLLKKNIEEAYSKPELEDAVIKK